MNRVVELKGGLANQLFQWATFTFGSSSSTATTWDERFVCRPGMPQNRLIDVGIIQPSSVLSSGVLARAWWGIVSLMPRRIRGYLAATVPAIAPRGTTECASLGEVCGSAAWYRGYFQNPRLFSVHREVIRAALEESRLAASVSALSSPYAAVHVRRGDYVTVARNEDRLGVCSLDYFLNAVGYLSADLQLVLVSDDYDWCERVLIPRLGRPATIIRGNSDVDDFAILRNAREIVMSNSTFSWWSAFAGRPTTVVGPHPWFDAADAGGEHLCELATLLLDKSSGARALL